MKANCKGRARYDVTTYEMYQDHICQAPDPNEIEKALFTYEIRQKAELRHDPPRYITHEAHLKLSFDAAIIVPQCTALQCIGLMQKYPPIFFLFYVSSFY